MTNGNKTNGTKTNSNKANGTKTDSSKATGTGTNSSTAGNRSRKTQNLFSRAGEEWLSGRSFEIKDSTRSSYRYTLDRYILPELGRCPLKRVDTACMKKFADGMAERGLGASTINETLIIIRMILEYAEKSGYTVAARREVPLMRRREKKVSVLSEEEQRRLIAFLFRKDSPLPKDSLPRESSAIRREIRTGLILSLYAGLRIGEVCALKWKNVDLVKGTLTVEKTLCRIYKDAGKERTKPSGNKTRIEISAPKTENSRREIPLPSLLQDYLRKELQELGVNGESYILTGTAQPMEPRGYSYHFRKLRKKLGLSQCNYHMLRHTFATNCIDAGFDLKALSEILGHANISTTLALYVHPTMRMKRDYIEKLTSSLSIPAAQ